MSLQNVLVKMNRNSVSNSKIQTDWLLSGLSWAGYLAGGFKYFLLSSLPGEMIPFDEHIFNFSSGLKPPTSYGWNAVPIEVVTFSP